MTAKKFRRLALGFPEALEASHMGHPDFRVGGKIFATLGPEEEWGMVKLTAAQQTAFIRDDPDAFHPAKGAWGRGGATIVRLEEADDTLVQRALMTAWRNTAPKRLLRPVDD